MEFITLSAFVVGITQVLKMTFGITSRYIPIVSLVVSFLIICSFAYYSKVPLNWDMISNSIIAGLMAVGMWSGVKSTTSSSTPTQI